VSEWGQWYNSVKIHVYFQKKDDESSVRTIILTLPIDKNPVFNEHLAWVDQMEVLNPAVLNCLFEGLSNLDTKRYEAVSWTLHTEC